MATTLSALVLAAVFGFQETQGSPDQSQLIKETHAREQKVIDSRASIKSGIVKIVVKRLVNKGEPGTGEFHKKKHIFFSGEKFRYDTWTMLPDGETVKTQAILTPDSLISDSLHSDHGRIGVFPDRLGGGLGMECLDPRTLGMSFELIDQSRLASLSALLLRTNIDQLTWSEGVEDGVRVSKVHWRASDSEIESEYWLALDQGMQIVHFWVGAPLPDGKVEEVLDCKLKRDDNGIWFPSRVTQKTIKAGKTHWHDVVIVESAELNVDVDPKVFTIPGLELAEGRVVNKNHEDFIWTNGELVSHNLAMAELQKQGRSGSFFRVWIVLVIGGLVLVTTGLIYHFTRRGTEVAAVKR